MAQITGSSTINWSGVTLDPIDFEQSFNEFSSRLDQVTAEIEAGQFFFNSPPTDTFISLTLFSGGLLTIAGSGLLSDFPVINSFDYNNPFTGDVASFAGTLDFVGNEVFNSLTIGVPGLKVTIIGNIVEDPLGNTSGSISQLNVTFGSTQLTIKGSLVLSGNDISGTVTQISVLSGTNTILMTGLSLPYSALDSVTTANDLFAVVGNQLAGNDTITYTNNSGAGMTFFGGAGNDTITISGPNADTLNGGDGNDILTGRLGQDNVNGGLGDDRITMLVTAGNVDTIDAGDDTDTLVLSGVVPGDHVVVVDLSSSTDQVVSIGGVADALTQINVENLTASGLGSSVTVTGSDGDNVIIGSNGSDSIDGGDGNDTLNGGAGADNVQGGSGDDLVLIASAAEFAAGEVIDGGTQDITGDTLRFTSTVAGTLTLSANVIDVEQVEVANAAGLTTGLAAINVNAAAVTSNGMTLVGNNGANVLTGTSQADTLIGNAGNDRLNGGTGDDTLNGGNGNDIILIGAAVDHGGVEVITGGLGADVIRFTSITADETLVLNATVTGVESVVVGTAAGLTTGTTPLNVDASNVATGLTLTGNAGANVLTGTGVNDILNGGAGNDTLNGGLGTNTLSGGIGNDRYIVDASTNLVIEGLAAGTDTVVASLNYTLTANVENLELIGGALTGTGNTLANLLTGTSGNNTLSGLAGADQLIGGAGEDTVTGGTEHDRIVMLVTTGDVDIADGGAGIDTLALTGVVDGDGVVVVNLGSLTDQVTRIGTVASEALVQKNFENLDASGLGSSVNVTGSAGANLMIGSNGADIINGGAGNDILNGGTGDDAMDGGAGNDTSIVDSLGDTVTETLAGFAGGIDTVQSSVNFTLGANVEKLTLIGSTDLNGTGNSLNNILTGNSGHNQLSGEAGNDTLIGGVGNDSLDGGAGTDNMAGGLGDDTYVVDVATDVVTEALNAGTDTVVAHFNYTLGANLENLTLAALPGNLPINGTGNALNNIITGFSGNNTLSGLPGNDTLTGGLGNDTLNGGLGIDAMTGGSGDDLFILDRSADTVIEASGEGSDTVRLAYNVAVPTLIDLNSAYGGNVENVQVTGLGVFNLTGNADANSLTGNGSNNILVGGDGNDTLNGGAGTDNQQGGTGDDLILIASAAELAATEVVDGGADTDTLRFTSAVAGTLTLTANVTNIEQVQIATAAGLTTGLAAINVNAAAVTSNGMTLVGNNGANVLTGTSQADTLTGNAGNDTLIGGAGDDTLTGGAGIDTLRGGLGNDTYQVTRGDGQDTIQDADATVGNADRLLYGATINPLDLVLSRQVNDLRIALHGTTERVTIQNWYTSPATNQVETIEAGIGDVLLNTQVDQLIQAMAQFTTDTGLSWDQGIVQQPDAVQAVLAASWQ